MPEDIHSMLNHIIQRIRSRFNPYKIVLFGSYTRGTAGPGSDLDLLIVMDVEGSTRQAANEIDWLLADRHTPMDFIVVTPSQYERQKNITGTLVRQADLEGKVIYEHAA